LLATPWPDDKPVRSDGPFPLPVPPLGNSHVDRTLRFLLSDIMDNTISPVKRRACVACTAAKARCTPQSADLCQRCARLGKSCTYLDLPQTRRKQKNSPSRVAILERKVDLLTSQLATLARSNSQISPDASYTLTNELNSPAGRELDSTDMATLLDAAQDLSHGRAPPTNSILEGQPSLVDRGLISEVDAECLITSFKLELAPIFPFALIANSATAASLKSHQPFLFLCVVAATMGNAHPLRKTVADEVMKHVTLRVVARSERNLELLRGLLIYSAFYSYPAEKYHPQLLLLTQLCVSILHDLGLHRKPCPDPDEQRAMLGTYWLSTGLFGILGRPLTMKHDRRIDEFIENMACAEHLPGRWIAPFIHIQSFLATVDEVYASLQESGGKALVHVTRGSLQRQFDSVRALVERYLPSCPPSTGNALRIEMKYVEIRLEKVSLQEELWIAEPASAIRTKMLVGIIQRSKELIETIKPLPISEIAQMTIITSSRVCAAVGYIPTAMVTLLKLTAGVNGSAMDTQVQAIVDEADYPNLVTELADALETRCAGMTAAEKETDIVGSICLKMRLLARCFPYQINAIVGSGQSQSATQETSTIAAPDNSDGGIMPQIWPSINGDPGELFPVDDIQWDSLLSNFTGFS
ncbi:hypothetical protein F1880_008173, partial [Penicillium rolfsii]